MIKIDETIYHNKDHVKTMPKGKQVMNKMKMDEHKKWKNKDTMMKVDETKNGRKKQMNTNPGSGKNRWTLMVSCWNMRNNDCKPMEMLK